MIWSSQRRDAVRRRKRRDLPTVVRPLLLEHLDSRIVLSGVPEVACPDPVVEASGEPVAEDTNLVGTQTVLDPIADLAALEAALSPGVLNAEPSQADFSLQSTAGPELDITVNTTIPISPTEAVSMDDGLVALGGGVSVNEPIADLIATLDLLSDLGSGSENPGGDSADTTLFAPAIFPLLWSRDGDLWRFVGWVADDQSPAGLVVHFGGLLEGKTATVAEDGSYEVFAYFLPGTSGAVTATVTDRDGLESNLAFAWVQN